MKRQKWEYWSISLHGKNQSEWAEALDYQGSQGWEMVNIIPDGEGPNPADMLSYKDKNRFISRFLAVFKRPKNRSREKSKRPKGVPQKLWRLALDVFKDTKDISAWFSKKNKGLDGKTPIEVIKAGGSDTIEAIFFGIAHGNHA